MQLDAQDFLRLTKKTKTLCTFDLEATGLNGDYNSILVISIKPYGEKPVIFADLPDRRAVVAKKAVKMLADFDCWVSYYGKGYDIKMIRTNLLGANTRIDVPRKPHLDLYFSVVAHKLNTSHKSQGHINAWLYDEEKLEAKKMQKMTVGAGVWQDVVAKQMKTRLKALDILIERCSSDTVGLEGQLDKTDYLVRDITR